MKCCILMGSPRKTGNTIALVRPFMDELERNGVPCRLIWLYDKKINPCTGCRKCQENLNSFSCVQTKDDTAEIFSCFYESGLAVFATPIYSWYCTPPMKALLDRFVYGMNKLYGAEKGGSLCAGKNIALITTCGYRPEYGADLFEEGMKRYSKHSRLNYMGMLSERHMGYGTVFEDEDKIKRAREFAASLINKKSRENGS